MCIFVIERHGVKIYLDKSPFSALNKSKDLRHNIGSQMHTRLSGICHIH